MENFNPFFKEKADPKYDCPYFPGQKGYYHPNNEQYYYKDGNWVRCDEYDIEGLWQKWIVSENAEKYIDDEGFTVFGSIHSPIDNHLKR